MFVRRVADTVRSSRQLMFKNRRFLEFLNLDQHFRKDECLDLDHCCGRRTARKELPVGAAELLLKLDIGDEHWVRMMLFRGADESALGFIHFVNPSSGSVSWTRSTRLRLHNPFHGLTSLFSVRCMKNRKIKRKGF